MRSEPRGTIDSTVTMSAVVPSLDGATSSLEGRVQYPPRTTSEAELERVRRHCLSQGLGGADSLAKERAAAATSVIPDAS